MGLQKLKEIKRRVVINKAKIGGPRVNAGKSVLTNVRFLAPVARIELSEVYVSHLLALLILDNLRRFIVWSKLYFGLLSSPRVWIQSKNKEGNLQSQTRNPQQRGCQFLTRAYLMQCKKQTIVAISTTEAEYVAAANYCRQLLASKTGHASGEEQVEDISPTTLEAAAILTKVKKIKSVDKGKRYKKRKSSKESAGTGLDFEEVKSAFEKVSTGGIKVSFGIEEINTGSLDVNTGIDPVTTDSIRVSVPSLDRGKREGKAPMTEEEETQASRKTIEQILQEEAGLAEAIRLDALEKALEKEEVAKQVHLDSLLAQRMAEEQELTEEQKKRKAQVQFEAQSYTKEDWDTITLF
ncbi:hypothetical protein Tco_0364397 [Tanacetum coccineum]